MDGGQNDDERALPAAVLVPCSASSTRQFQSVLSGECYYHTLPHVESPWIEKGGFPVLRPLCKGKPAPLWPCQRRPPAPTVPYKQGLVLPCDLYPINTLLSLFSQRVLPGKKSYLGAGFKGEATNWDISSVSMIWVTGMLLVWGCAYRMTSNFLARKILHFQFRVSSTAKSAGMNRGFKWCYSSRWGLFCHSTDDLGPSGVWSGPNLLACRNTQTECFYTTAFPVAAWPVSLLESSDL